MILYSERLEKAKRREVDLEGHDRVMVTTLEAYLRILKASMDRFSSEIPVDFLHRFTIKIYTSNTRLYFEVLERETQLTRIFIFHSFYPRILHDMYNLKPIDRARVKPPVE